jgi:uncharacterized membrane protein
VAVIGKDEKGNLQVLKAEDEGPLGTATGALVGTLVGFLGGPVGAAVGLAGGAMVGSLGDFFNTGVSASFLEGVGEQLTPGRAAVVAEVSEDWVTPLDTRIEALGGFVIREWRAEYEDEIYAQEIRYRKAELAELKAELSQTAAENRARLQARIEKAEARLQQSIDRTQTWIDTRQRETEAKIRALQAQAEKSKAETRARIESRISHMRSEYKRRSEKLHQAMQLTREALAA